MTTYAITNGTQELFTDNIELIYAVKQLLLQFTTDFEIGTEDGTVIWSRSDGMVDTVPVPEQLKPKVFGLAAVYVAALCNTPFYVYQASNGDYHVFGTESALEKHSDVLANDPEMTQNGSWEISYHEHSKTIIKCDDSRYEDPVYIDIGIEEVRIKC